MRALTDIARGDTSFGTARREKQHHAICALDGPISRKPAVAVSIGQNAG